jgi:hypothetical protein
MSNREKLNELERIVNTLDHKSPCSAKSQNVDYIGYLVAFCLGALAHYIWI